jgi:hypothetical protein
MRASRPFPSRNGWISTSSTWTTANADTTRSLLVNVQGVSLYSGPRSRPSSVDFPDIRRREAMVLVVSPDQFIQDTTLFPPLDLIHLSLALDAEEIFQNAPTRARFELSVDRI